VRDRAAADHHGGHELLAASVERALVRAGWR
jgi:hypothetical protein